MYHVSQDLADNEECSLVCMQAPSQDFIQEGGNLERALPKDSPYQKSKIHWIWPTVFDESCILQPYFIFAIILFYFSIPIRRGDV